MKNLTNKALGIVMVSAFTVTPILSNAQIGSNLTADITGDSVTEIIIGTDTTSTPNSDMDTNLGVDVNSEVNMDDDAEFYINSESDVTLRVNSNGVAIISSSQVESENDLEIFSDNLSIREEKISDVEIDTDADGATEIKVVHRNEAKLFGFIPVTVKTTTVAEVDDESEMKVDSKVSWWSFMATSHSERKARVHEIEQNLKSNTTLTANLSADVSAQAKAEVAEAIIAELNARQNIEASAQASVDN